MNYIIFPTGTTSIEGTAILSTGETGVKFLRSDGDGSCSWQAIAGGGDALTGSPLSQFAPTTSSQLAGVISDETGTGALVFANSPTLVDPALGTPASGVLTNCTGLPAGSVIGLATVATSGDYDDLINAPSIPAVNSSTVQEAGALMDSEVTNLAQVKAFDSSDYATTAQGATADTAIQPADISGLTGGTTGQIATKASGDDYDLTWVDDLTVPGLLTADHIHGNIAGTLYIHVKNTSGGTLAKGTPVYVTGHVGSSDRVEVAAADQSDPAKMPAIALLAEELANNGEGDGVIVGEIRSFDTDTPGYALNEELFVGTGALTATKPTSGAVQPVATVGRLQTSTGVLVINCQGQRAPDETFATSAQGAKADTATQPGDLASVATSGDYDDLSNKPIQPIQIPALAGNPTSSNGATVTSSEGEASGMSFPDTGDTTVVYSVVIPSGSAGTFSVSLRGDSSATASASEEWAVSIEAKQDDEASYGTPVAAEATITAASTPHTITSGTITPSGSPTAGDIVYIKITRDVSEESTSSDGDVLLREIIVTFH